MERQRNPGQWQAGGRVDPDCAPPALHPGYGLLILDAIKQRYGDLLKALLQAHLKAGWQVARLGLAE